MPLSFVKSRRGLAFAMLGFVLEALCVLGRAPSAIELPTPITEAAFALETAAKVRTLALIEILFAQVKPEAGAAEYCHLADPSADPDARAPRWTSAPLGQNGQFTGAVGHTIEPQRKQRHAPG